MQQCCGFHTESTHTYTCAMYVAHNIILTSSKFYEMYDSKVLDHNIRMSCVKHMYEIPSCIIILCDCDSALHESVWIKLWMHF